MIARPDFFGPMIATCCFMMFVVGMVTFGRYTGLRWAQAMLALLCAVIGAGAYMWDRGDKEPIPPGNDEHQWARMIIDIIAGGCCIVLLVALVLRLWGRWIGGKSTPAEFQPGMQGIRGWFGGANVFVGTSIVITAWLGFSMSPVFSAIWVSLVFAAQPLLLSNRLDKGKAYATPPATQAEDLSPEREKIVSMLENGKLNAEEAAELLQALRSTAPGAGAPIRPVLTPGQRLMLIGAAIVTVGFFLPWFVFNPGQEINQMIGSLHVPQISLQQHATASSRALLPEISPDLLAQPQISTGAVYVSGGDIGHGMGWAALFLVLGSALLPYLSANLDETATRALRMLTLGVGCLIMLYLVTQNLRHVYVGSAVALLGYVVAVLGAMREHRLVA